MTVEPFTINMIKVFNRDWKKKNFNSKKNSKYLILFSIDYIC